MKYIYLSFFFLFLFSCTLKNELDRKPLFTLQAGELGIDTEAKQPFPNNIIWDKDDFYYDNFYALAGNNYIFYNRTPGLLLIKYNKNKKTYTNSYVKDIYFLQASSSELAEAVLIDTGRKHIKIIHLCLSNAAYKVAASASLSNSKAVKDTVYNNYVQELTTNAQGIYLLHNKQNRILLFKNGALETVTLPRNILAGDQLSMTNISFRRFFLKSGTDKCYLIYHQFADKTIKATVISEYNYIRKQNIKTVVVPYSKGVFFSITAAHEAVFADYLEDQKTGIYTLYDLASTENEKTAVYLFRKDEFPYDFSYDKERWIGFYKIKNRLEFYLWN